MSVQGVPRLLLVEDDRGAAAAVAEVMRQRYGSETLRLVGSLREAAGIETQDLDLVLTELRLPDGSGLDVLERVFGGRPDLPVVILTSAADLDLALAAIQRGAYDYVLKAGDWALALPISIEKNLAIWRTKQENLRLQLQITRTLEELRLKNKQLEEAVQQLERAASTDPLTGLANRRAFNGALEHCFAHSSRYGHDLGCIMIDVDGFKHYNDTHGHQTGDVMIQRLAKVLQANCRRSDVAGRYGGDEFILLLPETDAATARLVAKRIADEFDAACQAMHAQDPHFRRPSLSMGLACLRHSRPSGPEQLVAHADHALYRAKQLGKARMILYSAAAGRGERVRAATGGS